MRPDDEDIWYPGKEEEYRCDVCDALLRRAEYAGRECAACKAKRIAKSECPSCHGLNLSCPDGCGRDPKTGELNGTRLIR